MSRADKIFYAAIAGLVFGIFLRSFVDFGIAFAWFIFFIGAVFFIYCFAKHILQKSSDRSLRSLQTFENVFCSAFIVAIFLFFFALGMVRYEFSDRAASLTVGRNVSIEGIIADEPDEREQITRLVVESGGAKVLITANKEPRYSYGDKISVSGRLERPDNFKDETTMREVDYKSYLAKEGIYYEMFLPQIKLLSRGEGNFIAEKLFAFKNAFIENINQLIPQPHSALLAGLVVGAKQSLGKKLLDDFRTVGVIHIVVLSGYNITIIARFIEWIFSAFSRNKRLILAASAMILFAIMVGASATVVRATIMALIAVLARGTGRIYAVTRALLIAGALMLLHNPKILVFDLSFQLSFLATVGLIYISPMIIPKVKWITEKYGLREIVVATIATQIFVLPFLLYKTGLLSLVSLPVNLLILAAIPFTMFFGFCAGMFGFVWNVIATPFAWIAYALLAYELAIVEWFARMSFASIMIASFPAWLVVLWYAAYGVIIWKLHPRNSFQQLPN